MKKHLVMIVGGYYPEPSPTGKCADGYIDLLADAYRISVICIAKKKQPPFIHHGKQIYATADSYTLFQRWLERKNAPRLLQNIAKVPVHLFQCFVQPNNLYGYVKAARKQLETIHSNCPVDVVFSVGAPMAAHVAARDFHLHHPHIRWISYTVDSYSAQNRGAKKALAFEASVLCDSDQVLLSEEIYQSSPKLYEKFHEKCKELPYMMPGMPVRDEGRQYLNPDRCNLVYAGRFYKELRHPEYLLQLALQLEDHCCLHLYCQSDCDPLIDDYVRRSNGKILRHAPVSVEAIQKIYAEADVLVSVGNNTPEFKPSKTFEYIASGKPIVNVYYAGQQDAVLDRYPMALQLERDQQVEVMASKLREFIRCYQGKTAHQEQIETIFAKHGRENIRSILQEAVTPKVERKL